jgi:oxalate decarboxylase
MTVFAASAQAGTFDYQAGDVGYIPRAMGHYVENTGTTALRFLEVIRSDHYADVSLAKWLSLTPPELVCAHLGIDKTVLARVPSRPTPVVPA